MQMNGSQGIVFVGDLLALGSIGTTRVPVGEGKDGHVWMSMNGPKVRRT